jgi:hypothetical protein
MCRPASTGDLRAWGDSNLYLRRRDRQIMLTIEHRSAPAPRLARSNSPTARTCIQLLDFRP